MSKHFPNHTILFQLELINIRTDWNIKYKWYSQQEFEINRAHTGVFKSTNMRVTKALWNYKKIWLKTPVDNSTYLHRFMWHSWFQTRNVSSFTQVTCL